MTGDDELDALIESVTRGEPVDWERAGVASNDRVQRARLRALQDVTRLAEFHHSLQGEAGPASGRAIERWGDLLLLERLGAGSSGEVHRAWDPALQREVALKLFMPGERDGALEEARALAGVRHPHVAAVYGSGEHDGRAGVWMEFVPGPTLEAEIARRGALPPDEVARLGAQLADALSAAHAAGTLHRDVKPANVVMAPGGRAVLTDFGLGRRAAGLEARPFSGTPLFMSPQRLAGAAARATDDLYALGMTLRWALTGEAPLAAGSLEALRAEATRGPARALRAARPDAPAALTAAIDRAMSPAPEQRPASAEVLAAALRAAVAGGPARHASRRLWPAVVIAAGLVVVVAVTLLATRPPRQRAHDATTAAPTAPVTPVSYDVGATFLRRGRTGDTPIDSGDRVAPGDKLSLEFRATRAMWVYVLDSDDRGECYLLFPQPMFDRANPLPANTSVVLPGTRAGRENAWTVTSRGGHERLLVVASPQPIAELDAELVGVPAPVPDAPIRYARVAAGTVQRLRGMGGVSEVSAPSEPAAPGGAFERVRALAGREQGVHGTWLRQVVLENPLR